jgi:hypothetical protein
MRFGHWFLEQRVAWGHNSLLFQAIMYPDGPDGGPKPKIENMRPIDFADRLQRYRGSDVWGDLESGFQELVREWSRSGGDIAPDPDEPAQGQEAA